MWGADEVYYTLMPEAGTDNGYASSEDITIDDIIWNVTGNATLTPWRIGGKSITNVDRAVYSKTAMGSAITKVELKVGAASSITVNSLKLIVAGDAAFNSVIDEVTKTFEASSTITFTPTSPATNWASGAYYKFVFNVTVSGSSNKFVEFTEAKFYRTESVAYEITALSNDEDKGTVSLSGSTITGAPKSGYRYASPAYTVSPANSATVSQNGNAFTVTPSANTTVTINFEAIPTYTVTFNAEGGSCDTKNATETIGGAGVTLPSATIELDGWTFAGWAAASQTSTQNRPTLYKSGSTYYPTANTTLYAVYTLDGVDYEKYERATTLDQITSASQIAIVNASKILNNEFANTTAPTETEGKIDEPSSGRIWTLSGNNTEGFTLTNGGETLGTTTETFSSSTSYVVSLSSNNNKWLFVESTNGTNNFVVRNKELNSDSKVGSIEYNSGWKIYFLSSAGYAGNSYVASKIYVPVSTVFNSTPTQAIITPDVSFNSTDAKTLYLDGTTSYTNTATVTGIDKPISYSSSDVSVATVNASGVVTAVGIGTATITASVAAELGVNKAASKTYEITVKNTTTIAGLKALYNAAQSPAKAFAADLTDAVVTYVSGNHAYIQDASGAIYASCGSSLTAGKKINGAVSGTITSPNTIDEIKTINLSAATVTEDGEIPAAEVKTLAQIKAGDYDGKLVTVNGAVVKTGMNNATSGGVITDDDNVTTFNIIAPNRLTLNATEEGNFTGFVSIYGESSTYRLNIYEENQFVKTRNVATAQPLAFAEDAIALDEETAEFAAFTGQAVEGAQGTVTYALTGDAIGTVNASTGVVTLNGTYGTATITATAAAKEVTAAGVTTPYKETAKTYTVTVNPRYMVTFSVNGVETVLRQANSGASIAVPTPSDFGDYKFMGWSTSTVAPTDDEPSMTDLGANVTPENNNGKYYAVFAKEKNVQTPGEITSTLTLNNGTVSSPYVNNGVTWTFSGLDFVSSGNGDMPNGSTVTFTLPVTATSTVSVNAPAASGWSTKNISIALTDANSTNIATFNNGISYTFTSDNNKSSAYTLTATNQDSRKAYMNTITVVYNGLVDDISYSDYRTSLPTVEVTISDSKYLSFCYGSKLDFTETDVKAYKASVDGKGKVTLTKVDVVPAEEGVVLHCETPGTYAVPVTDASASDVTGNQMVGVLERTQVLWNPSAGVYNYILQSGNFNKASDGYLKPNRAYLSTSYNVEGAGAKPLTIIFADDETDGIRSVGNTTEDGVRYNLSGQKVGKDYKGIVIINGKKYLCK